MSDNFKELRNMWENKPTQQTQVPPPKPLPNHLSMPTNTTNQPKSPREPTQKQEQYAHHPTGTHHV